MLLQSENEGGDSKKVFGEGTKLIVTSPDKSFNNAISPKPTVFLPSVAETNLHKAGTYLCLLENFSPDVIKVYWKKTDDDRILEAQQGDTMKTNDTYMKFSWLTVTGDAMTKEHKCIVKHEANGGVDQEIFFDPIKEVVTIDSEVCFKHEMGTKNITFSNGADLSSVSALMAAAGGLLQLQLTSTSAYYTYLLLLLKSTLHGGLIVFCLLRGSPLCCDAKST
ncbi:T-cell receptor gamma chain C region 5/10-13 [Fukomys damarensis]|nr:T-cell receptor gamma chain C region 5/10-13 [Fukomys damarensis]